MPEVLKNFIVFEGLDGSGTTTQAVLLEKYLLSAGKTVFRTFEPADNVIGSFLRNTFLKGGVHVEKESLLYLYIADRYEHLYAGNGVVSQLKRNDFVICDRYFFSCMAYQSVDVDFGKVKALNSGFPFPELVFYIDTSVDSCMGRIAGRNEKAELFEEEDFLRKAGINYGRSFTDLPAESLLVRIDGSKTVAEISGIVASHVASKYGIE